MADETYRRIIADKSLGVAVLVTFAIASTGCPSTVRPVDTSQQILLEVAQVVSEVDAATAEHMVEAQERARETVMNEILERRLEHARCLDSGARSDECLPVPSEDQAVEMYQLEMLKWDQLIAALVAFRGVLHSWETVNDEWRASGERPQKWDALVCEPVAFSAASVLTLLAEVGVPVAETWAAIVSRADELCRLGAGVAQLAGPGAGDSDQ